MHSLSCISSAVMVSWKASAFAGRVSPTGCFMLTSNKGNGEIWLSPLPFKLIFHSVCLTQKAEFYSCLCLCRYKTGDYPVHFFFFLSLWGKRGKKTKAESKPILCIFHLLLTDIASWIQEQFQRISLWIAEKLLKNWWHLWMLTTTNIVLDTPR